MYALKIGDRLQRSANHQKFFVTKITINVACFIIYLIEVVTSAVRKGARMDEIHERDSVDYLMQQTGAVFTGVTVKIGFLSRRKRRRYVG